MNLTVANRAGLRQVMGVSQISFHNARYKDISDEKLMLDYGRDNAMAFDELYHRNKAKLYRYFLRQINQASLAEEFSHEVWLRIINSRKTYIPKARFSTYLFQIAHNCLVDHFRKASTHQEIDCDDQVIENEPAHGENNPENLIENSRAMQALLKLIHQLPTEQREVYILKEEGDFSIEEIAGIIDENPETVKSRIRYALQKLKAGMRDYLNG